MIGPTRSSIAMLISLSLTAASCGTERPATIDAAPIQSPVTTFAPTETNPPSSIRAAAPPTSQIEAAARRALPLSAASNPEANERIKVTVDSRREEGVLIVDQPRGCVATSEAPNDIAAEPAEWLAFGSYLRWSDIDGCPIRIDVVSHKFGPSHCNWQNVEFITISQTLGESITENRVLSPRANRYFWDPAGDYSGSGRDATISFHELAPDVLDTGLRRDGTSLWLSSSEPPTMFVVENEIAQQWEWDEDPHYCA